MRRHAAAALGTLLLIALTGCADDERPHPPRTTTMPAALAGHAPDVLVSVSSTGGEGSAGRGVPDLEVRADGTVFLGTDDGLGVETFTLDGDGLDRVHEAFAPVSMRQDDYAASDWTDMPSTSVYSALGDRPAGISVHGFGHDDEVDDPDWGRLASALDTLDDLAAAATTAAYRPATVVLVLSPTADSGNAWPLTPLDEVEQGWTATGQACALVRGRDVATLQAITEREGRDGLTWSDLRLDVRPVLRGTPAGCTSSPSGEIGIGWFHRVTLVAAPHRPTPLEAWRVADAVEAAAGRATGQAPPEGQLSSYETVWSAGGSNGRRWVEVAATYPVEFRDELPDVPTTWRVRVDAATGGVLALEVEGEDVRTASRG